MVGSQNRLPRQGELVEVRLRRYVVTDVRQDALPSAVSARRPLRPHSLVSLSSVEDDALGEELQVLWEAEPGAHVLEGTRLPVPTSFDTPQRLDTFLNAVRWGAASSADVRAIQAPFRSGIDLEEYQLDPVARAIQMPRANLLIADDVGLGKTIEAGLVAQELLIRHRARRILIVCPASLQVQWKEQMLSKFGLNFRIVDNQSIHQLRISRGLHANPWAHFPRLITSIDFLKRERSMRLFNEIIEGRPVFPRQFDLLILDEAHNVAPAGRGGKYALDSLRTQTLRRLAPHFEHKLFLSATPHNGYPESFAALLELLDNQRFTRRVKPDPAQLDAIMVRRLKTDLPTRFDGSARFAKRTITPLEVAYTQEEREAHQWLQEYSQARLQEARSREDQTEIFATEFVAMLLKKRLFSSPAAFYNTLVKHENALGETQRHTGAPRRAKLGILRGRIEQVEEEQSDDEALNEATSSALEAAAPLFHEANERERELLARMLTWAEHAQYRADSKAQTLLEWLRATLKPGGQWASERVILFTEYRDTQNWLYGLLAREGFAEKGPNGEPRVLMLYGGMVTEEREAIKAAFQAHPDDAAVRILLATDAASEGIDLQNYCSRLVHYEIPWNPNRLEQRNGRVDRHGQRAPEVNIYHFVSDTYHKQAGVERSQLDTDLEFLHSAVEKIHQIREDLGSVGPVIAQQVERTMLGQRSLPLDTRKEEATTSSRGMRAYRKTRERIEERIRKLTDELHASKEELGLTPANVQAVVQVALELVNQPPLMPRKLVDPHGKYPTIDVFDVPDLVRPWAACIEGLDHPHSGQRRPIVFDHDLARGRDDVVLAHLNHRLVTMSLRLLRAEAQSSAHHNLSRVTARVVPSHALDTPSVIAHARLLILGGDKQRLHEELIAAGLYLRDGGRFEPMNEGQLKQAMAAISPQDRLVPDAMCQRLAAQWNTCEIDLSKALEGRKRDRAASQQKKLAQRSAKEQSDITAVLSELKRQIEREIQSLSGPMQLTLDGFSSDERQQIRHDLAALKARAEQIDAEIEQEVQRIQQRFAQPDARLFPVAVTYIVPERLIR
ncbi:MAG TPA: DISARM system SNF2-like helicase DrmD [Ktedonobacteraceae bacterium]|nr:DISARM system SNF2-like helicase DrmD [Ktedonobacteraceae bacterium]